MSAAKILELAEEQGLLEPQVIASLRKQVQAKPNITAQLIAKTLTDKGLLTAFQAKKLVTAALAAEQPPELDLDLTIDEPPAPASPPASKPAAPKQKPLPPPPAEEDDDVVMLEAVPPPEAPKPKPKTPAPTPKPKPAPAPASDLLDLAPLDDAPPPAPAPVPKPAPKPAPAPTRAEKPKPSPRPAAPAAPVDLAPLESLEAVAPAAPVQQPKPRPAPPAPLAAPAPLDVLDPAPLGSPAPLGGIDDLLAPMPSGPSGDPFAQPAAASGGPLQAAPEAKPAKQGFQKKVGRTNVWDSPLLLIGGGVLLLLVAGIGLMFYSITRGSAQQAFDKASEEYTNGSYASAEAAFHYFLEKFPADNRASQARVMQGMSRLRQASSNAKADPRSALKAAQEVLPTIEREAAFNDARGELVHILPEIASGFAEQAKATEKVERLVDLTKLAGDSMALVNNPSYLSPDDRKNIEVRINTIVQMLSDASRSIDQDKNLQAGIESINKLNTEGKTAEAYQVRRDLVRRFTALETNKQLIDATYTICERERQAVRISETALAALTEEARLSSPRVVLASRTSSGQVTETRNVYVMVEGAVYGMELNSGKVLWRRYVGHETQIAPFAVSRDPAADVIVTDSRTHELIRLESATGKLRWRLPIGEPFHTPTLADDKLLIATQSGKLLEVNLASGASDRRLVLPQKLTVPPAYDAKNSRYLQLGEHSTLFVINSSLACEETYYVGHKAGAVIVPPVLALEHLLIVESPADDHSLLHVLARDPEKKQMRQIDRELRLKGRVVTPLAVAGRRITVVTDLGEVDAFEVDPSIKERPLQPVGKIEASEPVPTLLYQATDGSRLWLAGRRCSMFEIQVSLQQLGRKWSNHQDDAFLGSPQIFGDTLVHLRRRPNTASVIVEACNAGDGKALWTTQIAAPIIGLMADLDRSLMVAATSQAHVFEVPPKAASDGSFDQTSFIPKQGTGTVSLRSMRKLDANRSFAIGSTGYPWVLLCERNAASDRAKLLPLSAAAKEVVTPAAVYKQGLVLPLSTGLVMLLDPFTAQPVALPFQPQLAPGARVAWNEPAVLGDDRAVVIGDGKQGLYRISVKEGPQTAFNKDAQANLDGTLISPVAATGDFVAVVVREGAGDFLQLLQAGNLAVGAKLPLGGRWKSGPTVVGDKLLVELQERKLICVEQDRQAWQADLPRGPLSAPPQLIDNDLLLVHAAGAVARASLADGKELGAVDIGEPLGDAVTTFGPRLLIGGRDGVLHIAMPPTAQAAPPQ